MLNNFKYTDKDNNEIQVKIDNEKIQKDLEDYKSRIFRYQDTSTYTRVGTVPTDEKDKLSPEVCKKMLDEDTNRILSLTPKDFDTALNKIKRKKNGKLRKNSVVTVYKTSFADYKLLYRNIWMYAVARIVALDDNTVELEIFIEQKEM